MSVAKIDNIGGGVELVDINPDKTQDYRWETSDTVYKDMPVGGYSKLYITRGPNSSATFKWRTIKMDGTYSTETTKTLNSAWEEIDVSDALIFQMMLTVGSGGLTLYYSLEV